MGTPYDALVAIFQTLAAIGAGGILAVCWSLAFDDDNPEPIDGTGLEPRP